VVADKHLTGNWFVALQPLPRMDDRVPLAELENRISRATVALRGWPYPHIKAPVQHLDGGIENHTEWREYVETWRFMRSGLFIHHWRMREDGHVERRGTLDFISAIWSMTEVFQFARRLFGDDDTLDSVVITLELDGLRGRRLSGAPQYGIHVAQLPSQDQFHREEALQRSALVADPDSLPCRWSQELLHLMGLRGITLETIKDHQTRLLERRFN
jgi:hypothetical protein